MIKTSWRIPLFTVLWRGEGESYKGTAQTDIIKGMASNRWTLSLGLFFTLAVTAAPPDFRATLYPALESAGCRGCHSVDGVASSTRLRFPDSAATPSEIEAFGKSLVALVDRKSPEQSVIYRKPTARVAHAGGERIHKGSPEEGALRTWVDYLATLSPAETAAALRNPATSVSGKAPAAAVRRLTNSQYNHVVRDLLGDRSQPASQFPPEDFVNGFRNQYQSQNLSPILMDAYGAAAEKLTRAAFRNGIPAALLSCQPSAACRAIFIRSFGLRAFRRPLEPAELVRYEALFAKQKAFQDGMKIVVEAMLQSPNFLFRMDSAAPAKWKAYATASRLAFALWDTAPDQALLDAAARGELDSHAGVEAAIRRMLGDKRAPEALDQFTAEWLRFDRALNSSKDRTRFREFTADTLYAMTQEARFFIGDLVWNNRNFMDIFTADYGFMNGDLAKLYGAPAPVGEYERTPFPSGSERAGLLGQALFLSATAKPDDTSPTARGLFVREQFLCQHVPDPPPGVDTNLPEPTEDKPKTNRQRLAEHTTNESCARCHSLIDPVGFGFEKFDAIGQRREKLELIFRTGEGENRKAGKHMEIDLDTTGTVAGIPDSNFSSPRQLGGVLAGSRICQECVVKQYFRYVAGRLETPADRDTISHAYEAFRKSGFQFREMMVAVLLGQ